MNIIFLDIDGVLNTLHFFQHSCKTQQGIYKEIDVNRVLLLQKIVKDNDAKIVLSSTWRALEHGAGKAHYQQLIELFKQYDLEIFSKTPIINYNRPTEIKAWLAQYKNIEDVYWITIDDDFSDDQYSEHGIGGHLLKTSFYDKNGGLQPEHIEVANILFKQQNI